jgi:type II secretion system protein D
MALGLGTFEPTFAQRRDPGPVIQRYPVPQASVGQLKTLLYDLLGQEELAQQQVRLDSSGNTLVVTAPPDVQKVVSQLVELLDRPEPPEVSVPAELRSYPVPQASLSQVAAALNQQFGDADPFRATLDARTSQVLVYATPAVHDAVQRRLKSRGPETLSFQASETPPGSLQPNSVQSNSTQSDALQSDSRRSDASQPSDSRPGVRNAASGPHRETFSSARSLRLRLENTTADRIEPLLREMLGPRLVRFEKSVPDFPVYVLEIGARQRLQVRFDYQLHEIIIEGPASLSEQFSRLIAALDSKRTSQGQIVRIVPLRNAELSKVRKAVDAYRGESPGSSGLPEDAPGDMQSDLPRDGASWSGSAMHPGSRPQGSADTRTPPEGPATGPSGVQPTSFESEPSVGAAAFAASFQQPANDLPVVVPPAIVIQGALDDPGIAGAQDRVRALGADVEVEPLPELDAIILRGDERDVNELIRIIQEIERISAETVPLIEVYELHHAQSDAVSAVILEVQEELLSGRQGRALVTPLNKPNALLVIGWGEAMRSMIELIGRLDQPVSPSSQFRVFPLKHASASMAQQSIDQFFNNRPGLGTKVVATAVVRTNSVMVQAAPRDMAEIELLLQRLDVPQSQAVNEMRVFRLNNSLAADLAPVLEGAIQSAAGEQQGGADQKSSMLQLLTIDAGDRRLLKSGILNDVRVTPDARTNTLLVMAPSQSMPLLEELIRQLDGLPASVAQIKVFGIVNGDAASLVEMLRSLLGQQSVNQTQLASAAGEGSLAPLRFSVDSRTNSIIASGSAGDLRIVEAILLRLDEEEVQNRRNEVYRLRNSPALDVARAINDFLRSERSVQLAAPSAVNPFQQIESEVVVVPEVVSNALVISATPRYFEEIMKLIEKLDAQPPQVLIQVLIAEVALNDTDEFGVELGLQDSVLFDRSLLGDLVTVTRTIQNSVAGTVQTDTNQRIVAASNQPGFNFNNFPLGNSASDRALAESDRVGAQGLSSFSVGRVNSELGFGGLVLSAGSESVNVLIRALQEERRLDVLSRPQVMTLDNQPAYIQVGQRVPRITGVSINETGQQNEIILENVGLILGVTPRVSPESMVVMEIDVEKSEVGPEQDGIPVSISATGDVIRSPRINTTTAQTTVSALNGQTIVLGGLITNRKSQIHRRVPLLAEIPILGNLFRFDSVSSQKTELLVVLTPHVVRDEQDAERLKSQEAARMHWCLADVHRIHGDPTLCARGKCDACAAEAIVVYPDGNPSGEMPSIESYETVPESLPAGPHFPLPEDGIPRQQGETLPPYQAPTFPQNPAQEQYPFDGNEADPFPRAPSGGDSEPSGNRDTGNHGRLSEPTVRPAHAPSGELMPQAHGPTMPPPGPTEPGPYGGVQRASHLAQGLGSGVTRIPTAMNQAAGSPEARTGGYGMSTQGTPSPRGLPRRPMQGSTQQGHVSAMPHAPRQEWASRQPRAYQQPRDYQQPPFQAALGSGQGPAYHQPAYQQPTNQQPASQQPTYQASYEPRLLPAYPRQPGNPQAPPRLIPPPSSPGR